MKNSSKLAFPILGLIMIMLTTTVASAQSKSNKKDFVISVKKEGQNIKLKCVEGCDWTDLEFATTSKSAQSVDQYGIVSTNTTTKKTDKTLADFEFAIGVRNEKGFVLNGIKGTSWDTLSFTNQDAEMINNEGILPKD
jgi:hypothetical protein